MKNTHDDSGTKIKIKKLDPAVDMSLKNQAPRIIIINNISSTNNPPPQKESANACNLFKLPYFEPCQRSLGCQTQLINDAASKIETASQTPILNLYHSNSIQSTSSTNTHQLQHHQTPDNYEIFKYYETQQTQTPISDNNLSIHQFDASTSPLNTFNDDAIINDHQFWAEISTQTFLSVFEQNQEQQAENNNEENQTISSSNNYHQPSISVGTEIPYQMSNERGQACNVTSNTAYTQTSQSTNIQTYSNDSNNELDFIDTIILNSYSTTETQTSLNDVNFNQNNYQQMSEDCFIQRNSIQTQTFNEFNELVDNITQTPWDFNINDDLMF